MDQFESQVPASRPVREERILSAIDRGDWDRDLVHPSFNTEGWASAMGQRIAEAIRQRRDRLLNGR
jgi:hypothetical protein